MPIDRYIITDRQWSLMEPHCLGKKSDPGRTGGDGRLFLEGVFWIARTGAQWRDLPGAFGKWMSSVKQTIRGIVCSADGSTGGSGIGRDWRYSNVFSMRCPKIPTWRWR